MARVDHKESQKSIKLSTSAVLFLGTPHQGGKAVDLAEVLTRVLSTVTYTNKKLLERVKPDSEWLHELQYRYNSISHDFETIYFYETQKMPIPVKGPTLVSIFSRCSIQKGAR